MSDPSYSKTNQVLLLGMIKYIISEQTKYDDNFELLDFYIPMVSAPIWGLSEIRTNVVLTCNLVNYFCRKLHVNVYWWNVVKQCRCSIMITINHTSEDNE